MKCDTSRQVGPLNQSIANVQAAQAEERRGGGQRVETVHLNKTNFPTRKTAPLPTPRVHQSSMTTPAQSAVLAPSLSQNPTCYLRFGSTCIHIQLFSIQPPCFQLAPAQ